MTDEIATGLIIENYPLLCMDCANHLIMDGRFIIKQTEYHKQRAKLARATGLLTGAKEVLAITDDFDKVGLIKLIDEVLEMLK